MEGYDRTYLSEYDIEISHYNMEIAEREEELKEIYRSQGVSRHKIFVEGGGLILPIIIIPLFIWMITIKEVRLYGIAGVVFCILVAILAVVGKRYQDNKIDRLEREILELKEKIRQVELKKEKIRQAELKYGQNKTD